MRPAERVREVQAQLGTGEVVRWCAGLLSGEIAYDDPSAPPLTWLGGAHAAAELRRGDMVTRGQDHWPRVWAARALLYAWVPEAAPAVVAALGDGAWRVREMAAKVVRLREIGEAAEPLAALVADPVTRVRVAAVRALAVVGESEAADAIRPALDDPESLVRRAAETALAQLARRLDRPL